MDDLVGFGTVDTAYAGVFLDKGALDVRWFDIAVVPRASRTGKNGILVFFDFVAGGKCQYPCD